VQPRRVAAGSKPRRASNAAVGTAAAVTGSTAAHAGTEPTSEAEIVGNGQ
jgi:hypothetical protein